MTDKRNKMVKGISLAAAGFIGFFTVQEFIFELPSLLPTLLFYGIIFAAMAGIWKRYQNKIRSFAQRMKEKNFYYLMIAAGVAAAMFLGYNLMWLGMYFVSRFCYVLAALIPYFYIRHKERKALIEA